MPEQIKLELLVRDNDNGIHRPHVYTVSWAASFLKLAAINRWKLVGCKVIPHDGDNKKNMPEQIVAGQNEPLGVITIRGKGEYWTKEDRVMISNWVCDEAVTFIEIHIVKAMQYHQMLVNVADVVTVEDCNA